MSTIVGKISAKTMGLALTTGSLNDKARKEPFPIYQIMGIAKGTIAGEGANGEWNKLIGTFEAVNLLTGEIYRSGNAFLPKVVNDVIAGNFINVPEGETREVRFVYEVGVTPSTMPVGYTFTVKELIETEAADPFESMRWALPASKTPAIESAKATAKKGSK